MELAKQLNMFDVYIQSRTAGNDDTSATRSLGTYPEVDTLTLLSDGPTRVVVAVRLHAALMALRAGHFVIHLAYERKGFGAFSDLGLSEYVHNVNDFNVSTVLRQAESLLTNEEARRLYASEIEQSKLDRRAANESLISEMKLAADTSWVD